MHAFKSTPPPAANPRRVAHPLLFEFLLDRATRPEDTTSIVHPDVMKRGAQPRENEGFLAPVEPGYKATALGMTSERGGGPCATRWLQSLDIGKGNAVDLQTLLPLLLPKAIAWAEEQAGRRPVRVDL
jgi:hypothetical protein